MHNRFLRLSLLALIVSSAIPTTAEAQGLGQALRNAMRRAQQPQRQPRPSPFQQMAGKNVGGRYDGPYATVTIAGACRPGTPISLRYKDAARSTLFGDELEKPDAYLGALSSTLSRHFSMSDYACESATLTVYDPGGAVIARDQLVGRNRTYASQGALEARTRLARAPVSSALFEPANVQQVNDILSARFMERRSSDAACDQKMAERLRQERSQRRYTGGSYSVAATGPDPYALCRKEAAAGLTDLVAQADRDVRAYAARQPVSYEGLVALKEARGAYWSAFSDRSQSEIGQYRREMLQAAVAAVDGRVNEIETRLHGQIVADMNKPGGAGLVERLFGDDKGRQQAYRTEFFDPKLVARLPRRPAGQRAFYLREGEVEKSGRETSQSASFARWSEPTENEIGLALFRALRNAGGRRVTASVTTVPGALNRLGIDAMDSMSNLSMQIYDVQKQRCTKVQQGYRCSYRLYAAFLAGGAYGGDAQGLLSMMGVDPDALFGAQNTATFVPALGGWRAVEAESAIMAGQATQLNQLSAVMQDVVQAGTSAVGVLQDAATPQPEDPTAKRQREAREEEEKQRTSRRPRK